MKEAEPVERQAWAASEFNRHEGRSDGPTVAASLAGGLNYLRDALYARVHLDVEKKLGVDSMWMPVSEVRAERETKLEIELYQIVESAATVHKHAYVAGSEDDDWYLGWLSRLRLGEARAEAECVARIDGYAAKTSDRRRLAFSDVLGDVLPESRRAPLVLFRLMPLCVELVTALAFGDQARAWDARNRQTADLPAIRYCDQCHGEVLENGEHCPGCGNPLWTFDWLTAAD
jgi:hypothetical protein